ncbi:type II 3-dehydroquinate dehydratase [bacterium]|nr:type II 3-dehydroquinate dehydratase [bacterium]
MNSTPSNNKCLSKVIVMHGPNLNLLGKREPSIYGTKTLREIDQDLALDGERLGIEVICFQSNSEAEIIDLIHKTINEDAQGIIINPAAFTHTSIAIRDALAMIEIPKVEVHLSNIFSREEFRKKSLISPVVTGTISGFGAYGYTMALMFLADRLKG